MMHCLVGLLALLSVSIAPAQALDVQATKVPGRAPSSLSDGEIATNRADGRIFYKSETGAILGGLLPDLDANGYLKFRNGMVLGRNVGGKLVPQPERIEIQGSGSTGDVSGTSAVPDASAATNTLARHLSNLNLSLDGKLSTAGGLLTGPVEGRRFLIQDTATSGNTPLLTTSLNESRSPGAGVFSIGNAFIMNRNGGNGHREAVHVEMNVENGTVNDQIVGATSRGRIVSGGGSAFGDNPLCIVEAAALAGSQCVGSEIDTDAKRDVVAKVGLQLVDVAGSRGKGTVIDTAMLISQQGSGSIGYARGIQFGYDPTKSSGYEVTYPVKAGGDLITSLPTGRSLRAGIDFSGINQPFTDAALKFSVGNKILFGEDGVGGAVRSVTGSGGGSVLFGDGQTIFDFGGGQQNAIKAEGIVTTGYVREAIPYTPPSSSSPCEVGRHAWDTNYEYRCVATNTWKRSALTSW